MLVAFSLQQGLPEVLRGGRRGGGAVQVWRSPSMHRAPWRPPHARPARTHCPFTPRPLHPPPPRQVGTVSTRDQMDDGTPICLSVTVDRRDGSATFDFEGAHVVGGAAGCAGWTAVGPVSLVIGCSAPAPTHRSHTHNACRDGAPGVWQHQRAPRGDSLCHHLRAAMHGNARHPPQPRLHGTHHRAHPARSAGGAQGGVACQGVVPLSFRASQPARRHCTP